MSYIDLKTAPEREDRLSACIAHGATICEMPCAKGENHACRATVTAPFPRAP